VFWVDVRLLRLVLVVNVEDEAGICGGRYGRRIDEEVGGE